jgi:proteasome component ECM29
MTSLWNGLTGGGPEGRQVITNHFIPTIDTLIEESSSKLWRARVGACGAIADVIIGRSWKDLGGGEAVLNDDEVYEKPTGKESAGVRFLRLWRVAYRAMDDMHGSVRDVGEQLARSMRALTIRLCDPAVDQKQDERNIFHGALKVRDHDATAAAATSLRWLIRRGLNQTSQEVVGICISTLVEVIGVVKPRILEPSLPDLIRSLLLGMSGLEPAALNYLQLRSNDQEGLERIRLQLVQSGPLAKAVQKCLELLPNVGIETQHSVVSELDAALRQSAGFATRAATADAVSALCTACPNAFKFSNASASNPAVRLMRAFYFASERERGASARDKMIHALGNLAALCPASSVRSLALRACERYRSSTGNNEDPESRRSAAAALRTIASRASNQFSDGGDGDIWFQRVLPTAYLGRRDSDLKTASLWNEVWVEGGSSAKHTASTESAGYLGTKLEENMLPALVSECVLALRDVSWSRRRAGASAIIDLCSAGILAPVQNSQVAGISYNYSGPKACLRARRRAESSKAALVECIRLLIKPRFWTGKAEVMIAATKVASQWVSMSHQGAEDAQNHLLGFEGSSSACHWLPISISSTSSNIDDLFLGDRRFAPAKTDEELNLIEDDQVLAKETETCLDCSGSIDIEFDDDDIIVPIENTSAPVENISETVSLVGLCRLLCDNALLRGVSLNSLSDDRLSYRSTAFSCLKELLSSMHTGLSAQKKIIYKAISPSLIFLLDTQGLKSDPGKRTPPVLVAGAIACLGACFWDNIGSERVDNTEPKELTMRIKDACGKLQPAWTVREAALLCLGALVVKCDVESLCHHSMLAQMVEAANQSLTDRKFWRVR